MIKNTTLYLLGNIINAIIPFILLPLLTRTLSVEDYAQVVLYQTLVSGFSTVLGFNAVAAIARQYFDQESNYITYLSSGFLVLAFSVIVISSAIWLFEGVITDSLGIPIDWLYLSILQSALLFSINLRLSQWQIRNEASKFVCFSIFFASLNLLCSLTLVFIFEQEGQGRVFGQFYATMMFSLVAFAILIKDKLYRVSSLSASSLKSILSFGLPLVPHTLSLFLVGALDRVVIARELGLNSAGLYLVASQISLVLVMFYDAINKSYSPWLFRQLNVANIQVKAKIVKFTYLFYILNFACFLVIVPIVPKLLTAIAGEKYASISTVLIFLIFGQLLNAMYLSVTNFVFYSKRTKVLAFITSVCSIIYIILLYVFLEWYGLVGAAYSFAIVKLLQFILTWLVAYKFVPMPWFDIRVLYGK
ncbi:lipopolysaccharide biosynthesis protein [Vibrio mimicus]|uniref:lipopolysaccharide biosynthesis protein n=1 Tax=Vibrio mimicus TaxID=674 RepID=UPI002FF09A43